MDERLIDYQFGLTDCRFIDWLFASSVWHKNSDLPFDDVSHFTTNLFVINMWYEKHTGDWNLQKAKMCWRSLSPCLWRVQTTEHSNERGSQRPGSAVEPVERVERVEGSRLGEATLMFTHKWSASTSKFPPVSFTFSVCEWNHGNKNSACVKTRLWLVTSCQGWWHHSVQARPWVRNMFVQRRVQRCAPGQQTFSSLTGCLCFVPVSCPETLWLSDRVPIMLSVRCLSVWGFQLNSCDSSGFV